MTPRLLFLVAALSTAGTAVRAQSALSLGDAARLAAKQSGGVDVARQRVAQAEARVTQRRGALFPDLAAGIAQAERNINSATFGFTFSNPVTGKPLLRPDGEIIGPVPTVDMRYRLQQPLLDLGNVAKWRAAQSSVLAASADVQAQADLAAATAAAVYVRAARAEAQLASRRADSALAADLLRIARDQLQAGTGIALDVTRAESQLANVRAQIIGARNERDRGLLELKRAVGLPLDAPLTLSDSLAGMPVSDGAPDAAVALARATESRADVKALQAQETAQRAASQAIKWERTPQLGLVVDQGVIGKNWNRLLPTYSWGVQLSVGLFDGFRREGRAQEQLAASRETDAKLRELRAQSALEVRAALLDLSAALEQVDAVRERLRLAEQEVSQAQERFRAGVAGNGDVITALLSLNQARTLRNDALASYQGSRVALARAMGEVQKLP
ncbi:TolC family protein [Gemmatimonas sp.]|jgi:outer membrane protein TolC|uniref:TolC family protein n=1 Tax=Gemmatimonas sp. TaxID=1962908 RepID=UPI0037C163EA